MADLPNVKMKKLKDMSDNIKICRDFFIGALRVLNETYVPKWNREDQAGYDVRLANTAFVNMFAPIISGISGLVTRKEPTPKGFDNFDMQNVDLKGNSFAKFVKGITEDSLVSGLSFVAALTDKDLNRAYLQHFKAEDFITYQMDGNKVTQMVFKEVIEQKDGVFGTKTIERHVVFKVGGGEIWYMDDGEKEISLKDEWANTLTDIPVVAIITGRLVSDFEVIPRMFDIAELNKVMLNLESTLGNILSVVGNPVPVFYGEIGEGKLVVGVKEGLVFSDKSKEGFEYAEITGEGVTKIEGKIDNLGKQIDRLSFSLLQKENNNTVVDAQQSQSKNTSYLGDVATELEAKMNRVFGFVAELENKTLPADAFIEFKKEFDDVLFSDSQLKLLHELVLSGDLSRETFWEKLKVANILSQDFNAADEKGKLESNA